MLDLDAARTAALSGKLVRLRPLEAADVPALGAVGCDPRIWTWMGAPVTDEAGMARYVAAALAERDAGRALPFATLDAATGQVLGTTRFGAMAPEHLRAEIGWTWLTPDRWRTGANVEAKLLMLEFAFGRLGLRRVELKTDARNARSRAAIEDLGAAHEGTFAKHMVLPDGSARDSAYYAIVDDAWPAVRARLEARLARRMA